MFAIYKPIKSYLSLLDDKNKKSSIELMAFLEKEYKEVPGSSNNHQTWKGGYFGHIEDLLNIANTLYKTFDKKRKLDFDFKDCVIVFLLHDIEKPFRYGKDNEFKNEKEEIIQEVIIKKYGFKLNSNQKNALKYIHGEEQDYSNKIRVMCPLAAFCHICDNMSARIYFNYPQKFGW